MRAQRRIMTALLAVQRHAAERRPGWPWPATDGGQGWYGETNDKVITNAMFLVIAFFPDVILVSR